MVDERGEDVALPSADEAEQAILGTLLMWNSAFDVVRPVLTAEMFARPLHRRIFETIASLIEEGLTATLSNVRTYLPDDALGDGETSHSYIAALAERAALAANARSVAIAVRESWRRRMLLKVAQEIASDAATPNVRRPATEIIASLEQRIGELIPTGTRERTSYTFEDAANEFVSLVAEAYQGGRSSAAIQTGIDPLDAATGGLYRGDFIVVAGRPGMGKTAFIVSIARNAAIAGHRVGIWSMEMSKGQLAGRAITARADVQFGKARRGELQEHEFENLAEAARDFRNLPIVIDETPALAIADLMARARTLHRRGGLDLIIVDYIQLMKGSKQSEWSRTQAVSEITQGLKALSKELNVPVIGLSQLSRKVEERDNKRPQLSDLRESGSIEQDADVVIGLYREAYYLGNSKPDEGTEDYLRWEDRMREVKDVCEAILLKDRNGPGNRIVSMFFNADRMDFRPDAIDVRSRARADAPAAKAKAGGERKGKKAGPGAKAALLFGELKSLTLNGRWVATPEGCDVPKDARCIDVKLAKERFLNVLGPETDDAMVTKEFRAAMVELQNHQIAAWSGKKENPVVYILPGKV